MTSLRLLFVLDHFYPFVGGAETLFLQLCTGLAREGHHVTVVTTRGQGVPARETREGVEIIRVWTPRWGRRYWFLLCALPQLLLCARRCDLIHTATYAAAVPAWLCGFLRRKPTVVTVYEVLAEQWSTLTGLHPVFALACRGFERFVLGLPFSQVICISRFTRRRVRHVTGRNAGRTWVVYPAVDYELWDPKRSRARDLRQELHLKESSFLYLYFGRPGASKGVETLVDAAADVCNRRPDSHLVMLLAPEPESRYRQIQQQVADRGLGTRVTLLDPVPREELPSYLLAADCVVVPSRSEGFGYSVVEAATLGCPVVATSGHAVEEVAGDRVGLVPVGNSTALTAAIVRVAEFPTRPRPMSRRFTLESQLRGVLRVYGAALGRKEVRPATDADAVHAHRYSSDVRETESADLSAGVL